MKKTIQLLIALSLILLFTVSKEVAIAAAQSNCAGRGFCITHAPDGKQGFHSQVTRRKLGDTPPSAEYRLLSDANSDASLENVLAPFRISLDGVPIEPDDLANSADKTRQTDLALEQANIQVRFDGLESTPLLNITAYPDAAVYGERVKFTPYSNYAYFITRAELRIFAADDSVQKTPLAVIPVDRNVDQSVRWRIPRKLKLHTLKYVLRVYDDHCRFDETKAKILHLTDRHRFLGDEQCENPESLIGYGENHLGIHNIPSFGGVVVVNGEHLEPGSKVGVMGRAIPVDKNGKFASEQIITPGSHCIKIVTKTRKGASKEFMRSVYIPRYDLFYTALADITAGENHVRGPEKLFAGDDAKDYDKNVFVDGRLAFYLKEKMPDNWSLTASADTREQPLGDLFTNFNARDPHYLLRRLDPYANYFTYGDDSTVLEDAPTQGKFYVRLEKDDSHILWGNFQTKINGTDLLNYNRGLYGGDLQYQSKDTTRFGERRGEIQAFAADPGTLSSLEEFRATGGSLYYLHQQDIVVGSERVRIEVRDRDSGIVLQTKYLVFAQDYDVNYLQGRIILREALASTVNNNTIIYTGALSGNKQYLIVDYEYTPGLFAMRNLTEGGHMSYWFSDILKLGVTGYRQNGKDNEQKLKGADATVRLAAGSYIKLETANSHGAGSGALSSEDGGFNFASIPQTLGDDIDANAYRIETGLDFAEITYHKLNGKLNAYVLRRDNGFSAPGQLTNEALTQSGLAAELPFSDRFNIYTKTDIQKGSTTHTLQTGEVDANYSLNKEDVVSLALRGEERTSALGALNSVILAEVGSRVDAGIKLNHAPLNADGSKKRYELYGLAQGTVNKTGTRARNNRLGTGGRYNLNDRVALIGEVSDGNGGWGGKAGTEYRISDRTNFYTNYLVDTDRSDTGYRGRNSSLVSGVKSRYSDSLAVYGEERYQSFDNGPSGLMHAFGLDLAANDKWTWSTKAEKGTVFDATSGDIKRTALSLSAGYDNNQTKYGGTMEWRDDKANVLSRRASILMKNKFSYKTTPDWRMLLGLDFAFSDSGLNGNFDADYKEFILGYAYRPILNDRFNALFKYAYFDDHASPGQLDANRISFANLYQQRNQVLSADGIYDLTPKLALGAKLGYRFGELRDNTASNATWFNSQAWLGIVRADWHIVKEWDASGEFRYLQAKEAASAKSGALIGIFRQINENVKFGVGYNFTDFSDDLTDLSYKSHGFFINLVGKL